MLKFLRRYQKIMLAVFCVGLMIAFLIPQAAQQFAPNPATATMATTFDGEEITRTDLQRTSEDLNRLRRLNLEALPIPGLSLIPTSGQDLDDALTWTLMQRAAEHNGIIAGDQEAFNLVASVMDADDIDALEKKAQQDMGVNATYLIELGKQYLKAEQYRQLIAGIEYTKPEGETNISGSPGLVRAQAIGEALMAIRQTAQQMQQFGLPAQQAINFATEQVLVGQGYLDLINGHGRVSEAELRYALQDRFAELDLSVVIIDAEDRKDLVTLEDEDVKKLFERYAGDAPGTGEPYGLGYQVPNRVKLEALRIPIDAAREAVAEKLTAVDVRNFYDENRSQYLNFDTSEEGEPTPGPQRLTAEQRDEIRQTLTQVRAQELVTEVAQNARRLMNEDGRGLDEEGSFKVLPDDFAPTPLVQIASELENQFGIAPEIITVDQWVSREDILKSAQFTQSWVDEMPTSSLRMPSPQGQGFLMPQDIPQIVLGGKAGLFASFSPELSNIRQQQLMTLGNYIEFAKSFVEPDSQAATIGLQRGLPGRVLTDMTRSTYVFRITEVSPEHPATDMAPIADQVRKDALLVKAYESMIEVKDTLLKKAAAQKIDSLMASAEAKNNLTKLTRQRLQQRQTGQIPGVSSTLPIVTQAFAKMNDLQLAGGLDQAKEEDRIFAVEMAGDYKLAVIRLDAYRPLTRKAYQEQAKQASMLMLAAQMSRPDADVDPPLSLEALKRYTQFKWAEGFSDDNLAGGDEDEFDDAEDDSEESEEETDE